MHKILIALPCLLVSGLAMAKDAPRTAPAKPAAAPASVAPAANSKRFDMTQGGKRMTDDEFDAWMKKNGYRVATGAPAKKGDAIESEPGVGTSVSFVLPFRRRAETEDAAA